MSIRSIGALSLIISIGFAACADSTPVAPGTDAPVGTAIESTHEPESEIPEPTPEPQEELAEPAQEPQVDTPALAEGEALFTLDPELSEARFIIGEILANQPNTVTGVNSLIQGGGVLNTIDPGHSRLDEFVIDASGFVTDQSLRNRAIREFILQSGQYPVITFQPTVINGLPSELTVGESLPFEVVGLLTIREVTKEVAFLGEAILVAEDRVEGHASTTVNRSDFELTIPSVPRVAGVDEQVRLEIQFVALAS